MSYSLPASDAADFDLTENGYAPPGGAVRFDLGVEPNTYIPLPPPSHIARIGSPWSKPPRKTASQGIVYATATRLQRGSISAWGKASMADAGIQPRWGVAIRLDPAPLAASWNVPDLRDRADALPWGDALQRDRRLATLWDGSIVERESDIRFLNHYPPARDAAGSLSWESTVRQREVVQGGTGPYRIPGAVAEFDLAAVGYLIPAPLGADFTLASDSWQRVIERPLARDTYQASRWGLSAPINLEPTLPWGWGHKPWRDIKYGIGYPQDPGPPPIDPDIPTPNPDIKLTYTIMNLLSIVRLPERTPIAMRDITISLDVDSWAWVFSGTVIGATNMAMIEPLPSGPREIEVSINNHTWIFMVERYSADQRFADARYTVSGISRTQLMAPPYAPARSATNAVAINAVQAATDELEYTGFVLNWNYQAGDTTPDWSIPAGALNYQNKTPLEVIKMLADAAGAVVIPSKAADQWTLKPRFPASPWNLGAAYMDAIVHYSMVINKSVQWVPAPLYNTVFVSGVNQGKGVEVTRALSGGNQPAQDVFDPMMVHTDLNTERGRQIISASGNHALVEILTTVPEAQVAPGLIEPGDMLEYQDGGETWRGYVLGVSIAAPGSGATNIKQTARVIRFYEH